MFARSTFFLTFAAAIGSGLVTGVACALYIASIARVTAD
jgi:hypothetical protein